MGLVPAVGVRVRVQWNGKQWSSGNGLKQVWEWWFLTFDLPLFHYNTPHTAACTAASLLGTTPKHPPPTSPLRPSFITLRPSMDAAELRRLLEENQKATLAMVVCSLCAVVRVDIAFIIRCS